MDVNNITSPQKKGRSSNFELLRIVAMLLIIMFHITVEAVVPAYKGTGVFMEYDSALFNYPKFYPQFLIVAFSKMFGMIGNHLFILISGYFLAARESGINLLKTALQASPWVVNA